MRLYHHCGFWARLSTKTTLIDSATCASVVGIAFSFDGAKEVASTTLSDGDGAL